MAHVLLYAELQAAQHVVHIIDGDVVCARGSKGVGHDLGRLVEGRLLICGRVRALRVCLSRGVLWHVWLRSDVMGSGLRRRRNNANRLNMHHSVVAIARRRRAGLGSGLGRRWQHTHRLNAHAILRLTRLGDDGAGRSVEVRGCLRRTLCRWGQYAYGLNAHSAILRLAGLGAETTRRDVALSALTRILGVLGRLIANRAGASIGRLSADVSRLCCRGLIGRRTRRSKALAR